MCFKFHGPHFWVFIGIYGIDNFTHRLVQAAASLLQWLLMHHNLGAAAGESYKLHNFTKMFIAQKEQFISQKEQHLNKPKERTAASLMPPSGWEP